MDSPRIPIQNLYYLLCYAWNHLEQGELVDVSAVPSREIVDLFAVVLCQGLEHLARRGLEQGYEQQEDELSGIRGRIDALRSERRFLLAHGRAACRFDELSVNTLPNQIIKSTLKLLERFPALHNNLRSRVHRIRSSLSAIEDIRITSQSFRRIQLHSNNRFYRFLLCVCKLIHESALVEPNSGDHQFRDFIRDEKMMAKVFQDFLFNFIRKEVPIWDTKREHIRWLATSSTDPDLRFLPRMETDISLRRGTHRVVIDAKYYQNTFSRFYESEKIHSSNLYQLMSYLGNTRRQPDDRLSGMLIYPQIEGSVREMYNIQGFDVFVCTINLNQSWPSIRSELVQLVSNI